MQSSERRLSPRFAYRAAVAGQKRTAYLLNSRSRCVHVRSANVDEHEIRPRASTGRRIKFLGLRDTIQLWWETNAFATGRRSF